VWTAKNGEVVNGIFHPGFAPVFSMPACLFLILAEGHWFPVAFMPLVCQRRFYLMGIGGVEIAEANGRLLMQTRGSVVVSVRTDWFIPIGLKLSLSSANPADQDTSKRSWQQSQPGIQESGKVKNLAHAVFRKLQQNLLQQFSSSYNPAPTPPGKVCHY
jgi:hypothetical protein